MFNVRGGDFGERNPAVADPLKGRPDRQQALAKFLAGPLRDDRVGFQKAPFDHPQLFAPNGHLGDAVTVTDDGKGPADRRRTGDSPRWAPTARNILPDIGLLLQRLIPTAALPTMRLACSLHTKDLRSPRALERLIRSSLGVDGSWKFGMNRPSSN
jgi:hypothetical protein